MGRLKLDHDYLEAADYLYREIAPQYRHDPDAYKTLVNELATPLPFHDDVCAAFWQLCGLNKFGELPTMGRTAVIKRPDRVPKRTRAAASHRL